MTYEIPSDLLEEIAKLPPHIRALKDKYPIEIANVAEYFLEPPLEAGYEHTIIEIFHDDATEPEIIIIRGELDFYEPEEPNPNYPVTAIRVDGHWVYIEIEGSRILDRRGGMIFPQIKAEQSQRALYKTAAKSISSVLEVWQAS